jgi:hypothetical protein
LLVIQAQDHPCNLTCSFWVLGLDLGEDMVADELLLFLFGEHVEVVELGWEWRGI